MTVENTNSKQIAQQMGTLSEYPFSLTVLLTDPTEEDAKKAIKAKVKQADGVEIDLTYGTDYSVSLNTDRSGGIVSVTDKRTSDDYITIYREYDETQEADYQDFNAAPADTYEQCFDKLTMLCQQQQEQIDRSVKVGMTSDISPEVVTQQVERIYQSIDNVDTVADNQSSVNTVADSIENVNAVSENIANVNKTGANINNVNTAAQNVTAINDCADNIEAIIDAPAQATIAADSAQSALSSKESALASASSAAQSEDNAQIWAEGTDEQVQALGGEHSSKGWADVSSGGGANTDLSNITDAGKEVIRENAIIAGDNRYLNKSQITNCLLEVPQRVKVRMDGTSLVLEAGSVVIVPYGTSAPTMEIGDSLNGGEIVDISWDGSKLFYFVKYTSDKENNITDINTQNRFAFVNSTQYFGSIPLTRTFSSPTAPSTGSSQWALWYDTTNNNVKYTNDSGTSWIEYCSLPFATGVTGPNGWESIQNIFNGFGFIGSTIWADKGIKGLAANSRNADGTFNNIEFETNRVLTANTYNGERNACITITDGYVMLAQYLAANYYESITPPPADLTKSGCWWNPETGQSFTVDTANQKWVQRGVVNLATVTATSTEPYQVTECGTIRRPFQAADVNSLASYVVDTYSNGASWYRVYSDGWCEQGGLVPAGQSNQVTALLKPYPNTNYNASCTSITNANGTASAGNIGQKTTTSIAVVTSGYTYPCNWTTQGYIN